MIPSKRYAKFQNVCQVLLILKYDWYVLFYLRGDILCKNVLKVAQTDMKFIISVCSSWKCAYIHEEEWPCVLGLPVRHSTNHLRGIREYTRSERGMFLYTYRCPGSNHDMPMFSVVCHFSRHLDSCHILFHEVSPSQLWSASIASAAICNIVLI